jgi:AcrR family transcriptional regulator
MDAPGPLREVRSWEEALGSSREADAKVHETVLLTVGEMGYEAATVQEITARAQISADRFQRSFGGKEACFAAAYGEAAERLCNEILDACWAAKGWRQGFEAGLTVLLRFVAEQPVLAKALLIEVKAARGEAWIKHQEAVERLVDALDTARDEPGARPGATTMTAGFIVGAIEESLCIEIGKGTADGVVERLLPDLMHLAILQLFGEDAAVGKRRGGG